MTLTVKDLCLLQLSVMILVPGLMLILVVSLEDHREAEPSLQMSQYIFRNMQGDLVVA